MTCRKHPCHHEETLKTAAHLDMAESQHPDMTLVRRIHAAARQHGRRVTAAHRGLQWDLMHVAPPSIPVLLSWWRRQRPSDDRVEATRAMR